MIFQQFILQGLEAVAFLLPSTNFQILVTVCRKKIYNNNNNKTWVIYVTLIGIYIFDSEFNTHNLFSQDGEKGNPFHYIKIK